MFTQKNTGSLRVAKAGLSALLVLMILFSALPGTASALSGPVIKMTIVDEDPYPAQAGDRIRILLQIENTGTKADNVTINVKSEYPFSISAADATRVIGTMTSGRKVYEEFYITVDKDALNGVRDLKIRYKTDDENNKQWIEKVFPIAVGNQAFDSMGTVAVSDVSSSPASFMPGDSGLVNITLKNTATAGSISMKNATYDTNAHIQGIELISRSDIVVTTDSRTDVGILGPGDSLTVPFQITVPEGTPDGRYLLTLAIKGNSYEYNIQRDVVIDVNSDSVGIIQSAVPSAGVLELDVVNYHSGSLKSVAVEPVMDGVTFFPSVYFIGEMKEDDLYTIKFNMSDADGNFSMQPSSSRRTGGMMPGRAGAAEVTDGSGAAPAGQTSGNLTFRVTYVNGNNAHEETVSGDNILVIRSSGTSDSSNSPVRTIAVIAVILIILLVIAHFVLKSKRGYGLIGKNKRDKGRSE